MLKAFQAAGGSRPSLKSLNEDLRGRARTAARPVHQTTIFVGPVAPGEVARGPEVREAGPPEREETNWVALGIHLCPVSAPPMEWFAAQATSGGLSPGGPTTGLHTPTLLVAVMGAYQGLLKLRGVYIVEANHALAFLVANLMPSRALPSPGTGVAGFANSSSQEITGRSPTWFGKSGWRVDGVPPGLSVLPLP